ncbi:MAG: hypothetical protein WA814_05825 [Candidatus Baltobacteraceae bacterium]
MLQRIGDGCFESHLPGQPQSLARRFTGCAEVAQRDLEAGDVDVVDGEENCVLLARMDLKRLAYGLQRQLACPAAIAAMPFADRLASRAAQRSAAA